MVGKVLIRQLEITSKMMKTKNSCIVCGSVEFSSQLAIPDLWLGRFDIIGHYHQCANCGVISRQPLSARYEYETIYPEAYFENRRELKLIQNYGLAKRAQIILDHKPFGRLLDIGCGTGRFILYMRNYHKWDVVGYEPNEELANQLSQNHGLKIMSSSHDLNNIEDATYDVISMWDVLEHVDNPLNSLLEIQRIIRSDGILVVRLPNFDSWDAKIFGIYWAGFDSPRHLYVFNIDNITTLLSKSGFKIVSVRSDIGGYLNLVKSIRFMMTGKFADINIRRFTDGILRSLPARILSIPFMKIKDRASPGSEIVIVAKPDIKN
jgi:ubiquinone/menaquinone biosynthesis C-methylase UbiE